MKEAEFYRKLPGNVVQCYLCPHHCKLDDNGTGICKVRKNRGGKLIAESYGLVSSIHSDPIEKKPLYHFFPGRSILSIGSYGCNFRCEFCQNWQISQFMPAKTDHKTYTSSDDLLKLANQRTNNIGIAFTYNEPAVNFEFMFELALLAKSEGMHTAMITNGYITEEPLNRLLPYIDAFNVDLKIFSESKHLEVTGARLKPVLRTLKKIRKTGKHLEITHLVVTGINDDLNMFGEMTEWIASELGEHTVLHISRYFPGYKYGKTATSPSLLNFMYSRATEKLHYTYLGNIILEGTSHTYCHNCKAAVIERFGYHTVIKGLDESGNCMNCGNHIIDNI